jgi:hypothetical protein
MTTQVQILHQARQARLQRFAAAARKFELSKVIDVEAELRKLDQPVQSIRREYETEKRPFFLHPDRASDPEGGV